MSGPSRSLIISLVLLAFAAVPSATGTTLHVPSEIPLIQAAGPRMLPEDGAESVLKRLGMKPPPETGSYLRSFEEWLEAVLPQKLLKATTAPSRPSPKEVQELFGPEAAEVFALLTKRLKHRPRSSAVETAMEEYHTLGDKPWTEKAHPLVARWLGPRPSPWAMLWVRASGRDSTSP